MIARRADWPERLAAFLEAARTRRVRLGEWDCALMAAACVHELTGRDLAGAYRGRYRDARGWRRLIRPARSLQEFATAQLGAPRAALCAQRGDVVLAEFDGHDTLGVCDGAVGWFPGRTGLVRRPLPQCRLAWSV